MIPRQLSPTGIDLIKGFEGLRLKAYQDAGGIWTIGYGHTLGVWADQSVTETQAEQLLLNDVQGAVICVDRKVGPEITQNQFDALVSFVFNVGCAAFCGSTLLRLINAGEDTLAAQEFVKWDHAGTQVLAGLLKRREAERDLFLRVE